MNQMKCKLIHNFLEFSALWRIYIHINITCTNQLLRDRRKLTWAKWGDWHFNLLEPTCCMELGIGTHCLGAAPIREVEICSPVPSRQTQLAVCMCSLPVLLIFMMFSLSFVHLSSCCLFSATQKSTWRGTYESFVLCSAGKRVSHKSRYLRTAQKFSKLLALCWMSQGSGWCKVTPCPPGTSSLLCQGCANFWSTAWTWHQHLSFLLLKRKLSFRK